MSNSNKSGNRTSRDTDTRETDARPKQWQPASLLPTPDPEDGYSFRWVRKSMLGIDDPSNFSRKVREGWETCRIEDHVEMKLSVSAEAAASGLIEVGGLVLCKMPTEMVEQREAYYQQHGKAQMDSVDNSFMKENDPRMPLFKDRDSRVTFGRGSK